MRFIARTLPIAVFLFSIPAHGIGPDAVLTEVFSALDQDAVPSGILHDKVVSLAAIGELDGSESAPQAGLSRWRQALHELKGASVGATIPSWAALSERAEVVSAGGAIPIGVIDLEYNRVRPGALEDGTLQFIGGRLEVVRPDGDPFEGARILTVAPFREYTYRGANVQFEFDEALHVVRSEEPSALSHFEVDFDDGGGYRNAYRGERISITYDSIGRKTIRVRLDHERHASFPFHVRALVAPIPDDTLAVNASVAHDGSFGSGEAYVLLSPAHTQLTNPVVVIEGFDLDNSMNWDELYALLNQQSLVDTFHSREFDLVVLNFTEATDAIQKNAYVVAELLGQVAGMIDPSVDFPLVGASMGGLCSRYALTWMESQLMDHRVRTFISFDSPQMGASIPLGMQHWVDFFSGMSASAGELLSKLNSPAARQMLAYHYTVPQGGTASSDSLHGALLADLASIGNWPTLPKLVAIANGSGTGADQGFGAGAQIIDYEYSALFINIKGNCWAVSDGPSQMLFDGLINVILLPNDQRQVTVGGTAPFDNAPGGYRNSMFQMDTTSAPFGDIVAIHDNHCFIPTISALGLATSDLFFDIDGAADLLALAPFDAVYYPMVNEEHVHISLQTRQWLLNEIDNVPTGIGPMASLPGGATPELHAPSPNPFRPFTRIEFDLPAAADVTLEVYDVSGRLVRKIFEGHRRAGPSDATWDGRDTRGREVAPGTYLLRMQTPGNSGQAVRKLTLVR